MSALAPNVGCSVQAGALLVRMADQVDVVVNFSRAM